MHANEWNFSYRKQKSIVDKEETTGWINKSLMVINLHSKFLNLQVWYTRCYLNKMLIYSTSLINNPEKNKKERQTWKENYGLRKGIKIQIISFITNLSLVQHVWTIKIYTMNICPMLWKGSANVESDMFLALAMIVE